MNDIRVLVADDDAVIRASLRLLIDAEPGMRVVAEASDGDDAISLAGSHTPHVIMMDVQMPRMSGLEATRRLRSTSAGVRVIVLTMFDLDEFVFAALRAGASGFLLKNSPPAEILYAIRVAHDGNALLAPEITRRLIGRFAANEPHTRLENLTDRERETLILVGRGLANDEIAARLFVTTTTVRTYVSRILAKLGVRDRAGLVVVAYESGLVGLAGS